MTNNPNDVFVYLKTLMLTFLDIEEDEITLEKPLAELGMESLDYVETQVAIQKTFGVKLDVSTLKEQGVSTIGDFVASVNRLRDARDLELARTVPQTPVLAGVAP